MKYTSTRGSNVDGGGVTFEEAICSGYAPDGGLYVPEKLPTISEKELKEWSTLSYPNLTFEILRLFIDRGEISDDVLRNICATTLEGFEDPNHAVPLHKLGSVYVAELFHGPTFCFKDFGLGAVVSLLSYFASKRNIPTTLLVATTGDTGPAAVNAVSSVDNPLVSIVVHFPLGQISEFQKRQLTAVDSPCVRVVCFEGGGDDMDAPIKQILQSTSHESQSQRVVGVNSYNIARPHMQMVHFVWTYLRIVEDLGVEPGNANVTVDMVVPTGAMGNIVGGYMAKKMGVPIGKLCAGTNINDIVYRTMQTGEFHRSNRMERTLSEAINIQLPYNFERLLYYLTDCNGTLVRDWMDTVDSTHKLDLDSTWLSRLQEEFAAERVTDGAMCATIQSIKETYDYTVDPHTAVAISTALSLGYDFTNQACPPVAILSTASPCKFQESMTTSLGSKGWDEYVNTEYPERAGRVMEMPQVEPIVYRKGEDYEAMTRSILDDFAC